MPGRGLWGCGWLLLRQAGLRSVLASFQPVHDQGAELWIVSSTADIIGTEAAVQLAASPRRLPNDTQIYEEFFDLCKSIYFHIQGDFKSLPSLLRRSSS